MSQQLLKAFPAKKMRIDNIFQCIQLNSVEDCTKFGEQSYKLIPSSLERDWGLRFWNLCDNFFLQDIFKNRKSVGLCYSVLVQLGCV